MPPQPPIANVLKVAYEGEVGTAHWENVIHYNWSDGTPTPAGLTAMATGLGAAWASNMSPEQDASTSLTVISITDLTSSTAAQVNYGSAQTGTREGDYLPAQAAALCNYTALVRYRGGHPRTYLSVGVWADLLNPQEWSNAFITELHTAWSDQVAHPISVAYDGMTVGAQTVVSYRTGREERGTPVLIPIASGGGNISPVLSTIRRRTGRHIARRR